MPTYREIPTTAVEIQTGLWLYSYNKTIGGKIYYFRQLFASEGYCFYNTELDTYDEEGNLLPRTYYIWMSLSQLADLNTFHSVPVDDEYEIAGKTEKPEIA